MIIDAFYNLGNLSIGHAIGSRNNFIITRFLLISDLSDISINTLLFVFNIPGADYTANSFLVQGNGLRYLHNGVFLNVRGYEVLDVEPVIYAKLCCCNSIIVVLNRI